MKADLLKIIPVLPSADIEKDVKWYREQTGFEPFYSDTRYAALYRESQVIHLQWHANTENDPLLSGSVIRIHVKDIKPVFEEFVKRGTVDKQALKLNTPWDTHEFGFYGPNRNAVFFIEDIKQ